MGTRDTAAVHHARTIETAGPGRERRAPIRPLRILIVDDDRMIAGLLAEILEAAGHVLCPIERTEDEAVSAAAREQPDLMIVDVRLGEGDGIRAMQRILCTREMPHVLMSGGKLPAGASTLLKPFREADLHRAMALALARPIAGTAPTHDPG